MLLFMRSGIRFMYVEAGGQAPSWLNELQGFFRGHKRKDAEERQKANRKMTEGMDPMPVELYKWLGKYFLCHGDTMSLCYLTMSWNLCCRTGNTRSIRLEHLTWNIDALTVYFAITKTDQGGELPVFFFLRNAMYDLGLIAFLCANQGTLHASPATSMQIRRRRRFVLC